MRGVGARGELAMEQGEGGSRLIKHYSRMQCWQRLRGASTCRVVPGHCIGMPVQTRCSCLTAFLHDPTRAVFVVWAHSVCLCKHSM